MTMEARIRELPFDPSKLEGFVDGPARRHQAGSLT